ncbi:hypothetical protein QW060_22015 [Myroides ceti]|uniref:Uncharacterized protein n=1 Tax=Paenimyroides ceti TaxID=395087 RepID=A0ABT8CYJ5_9FLAO|nr:hypothetical protein [Paenimyroides ceti]MDN3709640.1 hypothetical protein [Paenimyroides ceti]
MINNKSHNILFKSMSLFGTTQVLRMICKVVAVKCASVFLDLWVLELSDL